MTMGNAAGAKLQSKEHRAIFDIIDRLRSYGISEVIDLPEIIVCGDQSAGKSSVLEAISGHPFPTKDGICTRFVTELVLRREATHLSKVSIIPGPERTQQDAARLRDFSHTVSGDQPLDVVVEAAKKTMGLSDSKRFSKDVLRVEISGPDQAHVTMVDLPGIFRAGSTEQMVEDVKTVTAMVRKAMERPRSIILAVVSANNEFNNQEVTELAREFDPGRTRTLGLITKPDKLEDGTDSQMSYIRLARNEDVKLELGWHVLRNNGSDKTGSANRPRDEIEAEFFSSKTAWLSVDPRHRGVAALRTRLSIVLGKQILKHLPSIHQEITDRLRLCNDTLSRLGESRESLQAQRKYLLGVSRNFATLMTAAIEGNYDNGFFGDAKTPDGYTKRIRAVVQNTLRDFGQKIHKKGKLQEIWDEGTEAEAPKSKDENDDDGSPLPERLSRIKYLKGVTELMERSRGRELPGTFNPLIIRELFYEQCRPWRSIASRTTDLIVASATATALAVLQHVTLANTLGGISAKVKQGIEVHKTKLANKVDELLTLREECHPITYNEFLTKAVQKAQRERRSRAMDALITSAFVDNVQVSLKRFVDELSDLAVERELIRHLPNLFTPEMVFELKDEEVSNLAAEDEDSVAERARNKELLSALQASMEDLKRLDALRAKTGQASYHDHRGHSPPRSNPASSPRGGPEEAWEQPSPGSA